MPTIKRTPLKTNTLTVTVDKVDDAPASNAIALSIGNNKSKKKKNKQQKKKKIKMHQTTRRDLNFRCKITKINQLIPQVVYGYCNIRKIPDNYRSKVNGKVTRNYNGCILRRCIDHGLTQDKEK
jgi:hypothetical protein